MFTIPVGDILSSYPGDSKSFSFSGEIYDGYFSDIQFVKPLSFQIRLISLEDGVEVIFDTLQTEVLYEGIRHYIDLRPFERLYKSHIDPLEDGDDVRPIENGGQLIDLGPVLREEIIMACHFI